MPGFVVIVVIAFCSLMLSRIHASFDALVISIIAGMMIGNLVGNRELFSRGLDICVKALLPAGIALYGMQLSVRGLQPMLVFSIFVVFCALFFFTLFLSRGFHLGRRLSLLLASGLSVCGVSAIAVISPLIEARREETSISVLAVIMLGLVGMISYPLIYAFFPVTRDDFTFLAGATLPMIGQVKVAAGTVGPEFLDGSLQIKLLRVSFLLFLVPLVVFRQCRENKRIHIPWFIVVFMALSLLVNTVPVIAGLQEFVKPLGTLCLSAGLAAIGFSVDFDTLIEEGMTPLGVIFAVWSVVLIVIYLVRSAV